MALTTHSSRGFSRLEAGIRCSCGDCRFWAEDRQGKLDPFPVLLSQFFAVCFHFFI